MPFFEKGTGVSFIEYTKGRFTVLLLFGAELLNQLIFNLVNFLFDVLFFL